MGASCQLGRHLQTIALLDTSAEFSVIGGEIATAVSEDLSEPIEDVKMHTRLGMQHGTLHKLQIALVSAPGSGRDVALDATVAVLPHWSGPGVVLGVSGFLEHIRVAIDPDCGGGRKPWIWFGV